jgi:hypothetical protein
MIQAEHTFKILERLINDAQCKPGWTLRYELEDDAPRLVIRIREFDNYDQSKPRTTYHYHPAPIATYNEKSWRRWIFDKCVATMAHELGEALRFGPEEYRPFAPMHGPGEDPYTVHEWRPESDALTTQNGTLREGPV